MHFSDCAADGGVYYKEGGGPEEDEGEDGVGRSGGVVDEVEPQGGEDCSAGKPGGAENPPGGSVGGGLGQAVHYLARKEGLPGSRRMFARMSVFSSLSFISRIFVEGGRVRV